MPTPHSLAEPDTLGDDLATLAAGVRMRRILVIDPDPDMSQFLRLCVARGWPHVQAEPYDPARGVPQAEMEWQRYDSVVLSHELARRGATGADWLAQLTPLVDVPPIVMIAEHVTDDMVAEAMRHGAVACLDRGALGPGPLVRALVAGAKNRNYAAQRGKGKPTLRVPPGLTVPGYTLEKHLASGSMADVYLARGGPGEPQVAVKVLKLEQLEDKVLLQRFMQEYQLLSRLRHANVIRIYERGFASDYAYIVMDYYAKGDLRARLAQPLSLATALTYLSQIASGLEAAHRVGVVHRDLKPANVLFRADDRLVITDFGVAKDLGRTVALTFARSIVGTLYYVSPEQITSDQCTALSDLYSLGALFHQMLTGSPPFRAKSAAELMDAHCTAPVPRLEGSAAPAQALLDGLLAKDPDDRFQSVRDLHSGIDWLNGELARGSPPA